MISEELLSTSSTLKMEAAGFSETMEPIYWNIQHHIPEDHSLILYTVLTSHTWIICTFPAGVHSIAYAFPGVRIVTSALDPEINEKFHVLPGIGNFGDRYFGTEPTEETWIHLQQTIVILQEMLPSAHKKSVFFVAMWIRYCMFG